jgi:hypothetical protein
MKVQIVTPYRVSQLATLRRTVRGEVTSVYPSYFFKTLIRRYTYRSVAFLLTLATPLDSKVNKNYPLWRCRLRQ